MWNIHMKSCFIYIWIPRLSKLEYFLLVFIFDVWNLVKQDAYVKSIYLQIHESFIWNISTFRVIFFAFQFVYWKKIIRCRIQNVNNFNICKYFNFSYFIKFIIIIRQIYKIKISFYCGVKNKVVYAISVFLITWNPI